MAREIAKKRKKYYANYPVGTMKLFLHDQTDSERFLTWKIVNNDFFK